MKWLHGDFFEGKVGNSADEFGERESSKRTDQHRKETYKEIYTSFFLSGMRDGQTTQ